MKKLDIIRAQLEKAKADRANVAEKPKASTMKVYPLRNQDQNRLVQVMHRESFSASDIYTTKLHRGILNDWLAANETDGVTELPVSGLMAVVTAALWNSRHHFNSQIAPSNYSEGTTQRCEPCLALFDFTFLAEGLQVLDTRDPQAIQSHATCLQTVIGDNGLIAVYHKLLDGSVQQLAKGRVSVMALEDIVLSEFDRADAVTVDMSAFSSLRHCYDVPPPLLELAYQHAFRKCAPASVPKLTSFSMLDAVRTLCVNHANLPHLWENGKCQIHSQVKTDGCTVAFAITTAAYPSRSAASSGPASVPALANQLVAYGELLVSSTVLQSAPHQSLPSCGMWTLCSCWQDDTSFAGGTVPAAGTSMPVQRVLLMGAPEHCAPLAKVLTATALPQLKSVDFESFPVSLCEGEGYSASALSTNSSVYDTAVLMLPNDIPGEQPSLRGVLALLRNLCGRCSRLLVLSTAALCCPEHCNLPTPVSGALTEMFAGALLTAQLEYLKCTMTMVYISLPSDGASSCDSARFARTLSDVLVHELGLQSHLGLSASDVGQELEVHYRFSPSNDDAPASASTKLERKVRRYHQMSHNSAGPASLTDSLAPSSSSLVQEGVYVITGGLGGLGLLTAQSLVSSGARKIVLLSRSGTVPYQGQGLEDMLQTLRDSPGVEVTTFKCDVSVEDEVLRMLAAVRSLGPIAGIVHAAGVLSDGLIVTGKAEDGAQAVWNAKAKSAHLLHKHTLQDHRMHLLVVYSSVTAAVGTAGQAAYAAANRYLESLMQERHRAGQCGLCVRWPEVSGVGMAAALHGASGSGSAADRTCAVTAAQVETFLLQLFGGPSESRSEDIVITLMPPALADLYRGSRMGTQLRNVPSITEGSSSSVPHAPPSLDARPGVVIQPQTQIVPSFTIAQIRSSVHRILTTLLDGAEGNDIPDDALLMQMGLDSLGATGLASQLSGEFGLKVPSTLIFSYPSPKEVVEYIQGALQAMAPCSVQPQAFLGAAPPPLVPVNAGHLGQAAGSQQNGVMLDDVAIIGTSLSFPGNCNNLRRLWEILLHKESTSVSTPADRWDVDALLAANNIKDPACRDRLKSAHFLTHDESFNCQQFNMTAKEAAVMHPSHRLLLINCLRALQDAGYAGDKLCTNTGVYVGIGGVVSGTGSAAAPPGGNDAMSKAASMSAYSATSHSISVSAGRISFSLGLSGPCMAIDTACSSSLVALHVARRSLQLGECDLALVCGVNCLDASSSLACAVAGMTSPEGVCRTFDQGADGYSRAEGCGVVVLKRLGDAVRDSDAVHCVVKGSAVKQDGKSASLTAPNGRAQQELLHAALKDAHLQPDDVQLLETHGTGTKLGDPVETAAIAAVFGQRPQQTTATTAASAAAHPLYLTGVKANVGHLEAGAGIAGLFSILLALEQRTAPPNALLKVLNEKVVASLADASVVPITAPTPLVCLAGRRLVAGVSSFGYSGTIAHVLLEEPPEGVKRRTLAPAAESLVTAAADNAEVNNIECDSDNESSGEEEAEEEGHEDQVWQFAGQGDLKVGAGKELYDTEESFRAAMARCDNIVRPHLGRTISEMLYPAGFVAPVKATPGPGAARMAAPMPSKSAAVLAAEALLGQTMYSQVALVALEYCLAAVWLAQGMRPGMVLGHSLGEYAAAVVAGVLTLEDALKLVCERGRLVQQDKRCEGTMFAVRASEEHVLVALAASDPVTLSQASLAASNGKLSVVLSGAEGAVKKLITLLPAKTGSIKLGVIHAFHSPLLKCVVPPFLAVLDGVKFSPLAQGVRFISAVRGREVSSAELAAPQYWIDHMLLPVQYMRAVEVAFQAGGRTFVEMGPQDTLTKLSNRLLADLDKAAVESGQEKRDFETMASIV